MLSIDSSNCTDHNDVDVQARVREVMEALYPTMRAAADAAKMNQGQLHRLLSSSKPGSEIIQRLAASWDVPAFIFFMSHDQATPYIEAAMSARKNIS